MGRNEPCWCGSGTKFKRCHLDRHREAPPTKQELLRAFLKAVHRPTCLHPSAPASCNGRIIRAHTIQRGGGLTKIARDGHVYSFQVELIDQLNSQPHSARQVGLRNASTFAGFCAGHDAATFRALETESFSATSEQVVLLLYRAVCRELYAKERNLDLKSFYAMLDRGRTEAQQRLMHARFKKYLAGVTLAVNDLKAIKLVLERCIAAADFSQVHFFVAELEDPPDIMVSAMLNPEVDFDGNVLQTLAPNSTAQWISFSLIATDTGGAAIFGWVGGANDVATRLVDSLSQIADDEMPSAIVRFAFEMTENTYAAPDWWDRLHGDVQRRLLLRMETGGVPLRGQRALTDDGIQTANWRITRRLRQ